MGTEGENCPALIRCEREWRGKKKKEKLGQKIISVPLGKDQKLRWQRRGDARGDAIARLSFHSQTSVKWLHLLCGLAQDAIIGYCTLTFSSSPADS